MIAYERLLDGDRRLALREGSMHFEKESAVHRTLERITARLAELGVPYAVAGGMALFFHGYRRFTEDVDILVTRSGLSTIHAALEGRGYLPLFAGSKNLRDANTGVRVEFLVSGEYPGDGRPKPVAFPDPASSGIAIGDTTFLSLPYLVELKLASGMTASGRLKDLADVQELIRILGLPGGFGDQLDPFVRDKFSELWNGVQGTPSD